MMALETAASLTAAVLAFRRRRHCLNEIEKEVEKG